MTVHTKDRQRVWIDGDGRVRHDIGRDELSNDLAGWLARDLVDPGLLDPAAFEETFVAVVQERCCGSPAAGPSSPRRSSTSPTRPGGTCALIASPTRTRSAPRRACRTASTSTTAAGW
jgi:hypothetical protein